jgi:hypothetical protein
VGFGLVLDQMEAFAFVPVGDGYQLPTEALVVLLFCVNAAFLLQPVLLLCAFW